MPYGITLNLRGLTPSQADMFNRAAARVAACVSEPLPEVAVNGTTTTGLIVDVFAQHIDGPGNVLGQAGPTFLRPPTMGAASFLPCAGRMVLDADDIAAIEAEGSLLDVVSHELLHLMGLGTAPWWKKALLRGTATNPVLVGTRGSVAYGGLRGDNVPRFVPVENTGGPGTALSHIRESVFHDELQTGWASAPGVASPLSIQTISNLADIGYVVDVTKAEPYSLGAHLLAAESGASLVRFQRKHTTPLIPVEL